MALYAIADLHLPLGINKPMDIFGKSWENYVERLSDNWQSVVSASDTVVIPGDFSWATYLEESRLDFAFLQELNGKKILLKGNHDYWWTTMNKLKSFTADGEFDSISFLQNNCFFYENIALCGTRGWMHPAWSNTSAEDQKIFNREVLRLELSLKAAHGAEEIYVFTHYPPMSNKKERNAFCDMMEAYPVTKCIYGHLHGAAQRFALEETVNGIQYQLVSADHLAFMPKLILE